MHIAIISDVHNNITNLKKVLNYCEREKIDNIICCGDLASMETLDFLNDNFSGVIYYTFGNMDNGQLVNYEFSDKYKNTFIYRDLGGFNIGDKNIGIAHYPQAAEELCQTGKYNFIFYGHTHKPWIQKVGECTMLNPGNVAGEIYPPTFAVWETENNKFDLIRINELK